MKLRFSRSSWGAFGSLTLSCFLLSLLVRHFLLPLSLLLETHLSSTWNSISQIHAPALAFLFLIKVRLSLTLTPSHVPIWQYGPICLSSTKKSVTGLHLFSSHILALSSTHCPQILWHILQKLPSLSSFTIRLPWVPGHSSLPGKDTADKVARRNALIMLSVVPCSLSTLTSRNHSYFFSDWRRIVSFKFFDTQAPSISTVELYFLVTLAVSSLVCTATDTTFF